MSSGGARDHFDTERAHPDSAELDELSSAEAFDLFQKEDEACARAVALARTEVAAAVDLVAARLAVGGRLFYVGAGTSGRLGVLDASECPPTFQSDPEQVQGLIAGGEQALRTSVEGAEDDEQAGARELVTRGLNERDVVLGIAAGGTTPYVHGALAEAKQRGAATIFLACVPHEQAQDEADLSIRLLTGPELLAGSTRLKAGTATKLVLNRISTLAMVRLGKVFGNRMVDVNARANAKLVERGTSLVAELCGLERDAARAALDAADGSVKLAVAMQRLQLTREEAEASLARHDGRLRALLESDVDEPG